MNKVYVAKLGKAVGLQGHLRLFIDSDFPEQFKKGAIFTTNRNLILKVLECNLNKDLIKFEDYEDVDLAKIKDIHRYPLNDYLEVETDFNLVERKLPKNFLIPHIFGDFIDKVDIENKKIFVKNSFDILENS